MRYLTSFLTTLPFIVFSTNNTDTLRKVDLQHKNLSALPIGFSVKNIETLHLGHNPIISIPKELEGAENLKELSLNSVNNFNVETSIDVIKNLKRLESLSLNNANLLYIPLEFSKLTSLKYLSANNNYIKEIPGYIFLFSDYRTLDFSNNQIKDIPKEIASQDNLYTLNLNYNPCINDKTSYDNLRPLNNLKTLHLKGASYIPVELWGLQSAQNIDISEGTFSEIKLNPESSKNNIELLIINDCENLDFKTVEPLLASQKLKEVVLGGEKFNGFNNTVVSANLKSLHISGNSLEYFTFNNFPGNLSDIKLSFNKILCENELISTFSKCHAIKSIDLSNCNITNLPSGIKELKNLETLNLSGNRLSNITELSKLKQLARLDISMCGISQEQFEKLKKELPNTIIINNDNYKKLALTNVLPQTENFSIAPNIPQKIVTKDGTEINIPKNSLVYANGSSVKENVTINYTPYYSLAEIAASGINMNYESKEVSAPFSSAGMFNLTATANGENLQLKKGTEIQIAFQSKDPNESYNYYSYDSIKRTWKEFGKDSIVKMKIDKTEDTTKTINTVLETNNNFKCPTPTQFYKYQKITITWHLNKKNKPNGSFSISSPYKKPEIAYDSTKKENYFNEMKALSNYTWKIDAVKFGSEIRSLTAKNKIFQNSTEQRFLKFLRPRYMHSSTIDKMEVDFDLVVDKVNDNFIFKFYSPTDTVILHAYPNISGKNPDRIQKTIKKMYFSYDAIAKERKNITNIRKRKFEMAYRNYKNNLSTSRDMINAINTQASNYMFERRAIADVKIARRVFSIMTLGVINCDRPIIVENPIVISPVFYTNDGKEINNGVYQVVDPKMNVVLSYYQPESIRVSKRSILTFLYSSGNSNDVYIGKLNTFDVSNRHGKVKVILSPLNSQVSESQLAQTINTTN